jgi:ArsR family transcriptional regulator
MTMKTILDTTGAFNDETRILIVAFLLKHEESCVCEIAYALNLGQSRLSRHLGILYDAEILNMRRDGKMVFYSAKDSPSGLIAQFFCDIKNLGLDIAPKTMACDILKDCSAKAKD